MTAKLAAVVALPWLAAAVAPSSAPPSSSGEVIPDVDAGGEVTAQLAAAAAAMRAGGIAGAPPQDLARCRGCRCQLVALDRSRTARNAAVPHYPDLDRADTLAVMDAVLRAVARAAEVPGKAKLVRESDSRLVPELMAWRAVEALKQGEATPSWATAYGQLVADAVRSRDTLRTVSDETGSIPYYRAVLWRRALFVASALDDAGVDYSDSVWSSIVVGLRSAEGAIERSLWGVSGLAASALGAAAWSWLQALALSPVGVVLIGGALWAASARRAS